MEVSFWSGEQILRTDLYELQLKATLHPGGLYPWVSGFGPRSIAGSQSFQFLLIAFVLPLKFRKPLSRKTLGVR